MTSNTKTARKDSWLKKKTGATQPFGIVPRALLLHPAITNTELRIFACLATHADTKGRLFVSRRRVAEMCGFVQNNEPNVDYISRIIGKNGSLVKKGFVRNLGQRGYDECCVYQLIAPDFESMPASPLRKLTQVDEPEQQYEKDYPEAQSALSTNKAVPAKIDAPLKRSAEYRAIQLTGADTDAIEYNGELILRGDLKRDLQDWHDGFDRQYPDGVYQIFGIRVQSRRDTC